MLNASLSILIPLIYSFALDKAEGVAVKPKVVCAAVADISSITCVGCIVVKSIGAAATPFTVVVKFLPDKVFTTVFTAGAVTEIPFTILVIVLTALDNV